MSRLLLVASIATPGQRQSLTYLANAVRQTGCEVSALLYGSDETLVDEGWQSIFENMVVAQERLFEIEPSAWPEAARQLVEDAEWIHVTSAISAAHSTMTRWMAFDLGKHVSVDARGWDGTFSERQALAEGMVTIALSKKDVDRDVENGESYISIARELTEAGAGEVLILDDHDGFFLFVKDLNDAFEYALREDTGGEEFDGVSETFIGFYLGQKVQNDSPEIIASFATMAASMKTAYPGPLREAAEAIESRKREIESGGKALP